MKAVNLSWLFLAMCAATAHADPLKDHLSVFFDFEPQDSVVALEQKSASVLAVTVADPATGGTRTLTEEVGAKPMARLLTESNDKGLKTLHWTAPEGSGADAATAEPPGPPPMLETPSSASSTPPRATSGRSLATQRKNRMWYIGTQTLMSTYVYGVAIPLAFDVQSTRVIVATPMIVAPFAFGGHFWFAKNRPFEDSHLNGTAYLSLASLYAAHALPFAIMDWEDDPYQAASLITLAAYPLGVWAGYKLGDSYVDLPGRVDTQRKFALGFGLLGFFSPFLYYSDVDAHTEAIVRLGLGQSVAMAAAGHFLADNYRSGENIPDGVNTGILSHTVLGSALGLEVAALADAEEVRPWMGAALLGGTLGFMEALYYYRNSYDSRERGLYNSLGGLAGTLLGGGLCMLACDENASDHVEKIAVATFLVGGTWLGYWATNFLTQGMEDRSAGTGDSWTDRLAFNPIPMPEPTLRNGEAGMRYRVQGITYRF